MKFGEELGELNKGLVNNLVEVLQLHRIEEIGAV
jgi:hypothetical protein